MGREVTSSPRAVVREEFFGLFVVWLTCFAHCASSNLGIRFLCLDLFVILLPTSIRGYGVFVQPMVKMLLERFGTPCQGDRP